MALLVFGTSEVLWGKSAEKSAAVISLKSVLSAQNLINELYPHRTHQKHRFGFGFEAAVSSLGLGAKVSPLMGSRDKVPERSLGDFIPQKLTIFCYYATMTFSDILQKNIYF